MTQPLQQRPCAQEWKQGLDSLYATAEKLGVSPADLAETLDTFLADSDKIDFGCLKGSGSDDAPPENEADASNDEMPPP